MTSWQLMNCAVLQYHATVRRKAVGYFSPHSRSALSQVLPLFLQGPRGAARESHLSTGISRHNCISVPISASAALVQHRHSLLMQSHVSYVILFHRKCKEVAELIMSRYLVEVAISRMYHSELPRRSVNIVFGLEYSHTVIIFPLMTSWSEIFVFSSWY